MSALTTLTGSPKLKEKISKFINELESLELEDQSEKDHKRQQIEMYRTRIREIKAEYDMRIRALELEESELEKQILEMEDEKNRIRNVLTTFQKELKVSETL
jgi:predicted RNase H-like nuclease (RuvC/YqgF family)